MTPLPQAVYFGNSSGWGHGRGAGPWIMADLEDGLWGGAGKAGVVPSMDADFVTAMVKGDSGNHWAIKVVLVVGWLTEQTFLA